MFSSTDSPALTATLVLYSHQALIIGYIIAGIALGPWGLNWVSDTRLIAAMAEVGIIFLLFPAWCLGIAQLAHTAGLSYEIGALMTFDSLQNIIEFQGENYERAYLPDSAKAVLIRWDEVCVHYETAEGH